MNPKGKEPAVLLAAPDWVDAELARNVLKEAGIPCISRSSGVVAFEVGLEGLAHLQREDLLVPAELLERARAVLADAWEDFEPEPSQ